jgi:hypothetical protein
MNKILPYTTYGITILTSMMFGKSLGLYQNGLEDIELFHVIGYAFFVCVFSYFNYRTINKT